MLSKRLAMLLYLILIIEMKNYILICALLPFKVSCKILIIFLQINILINNLLKHYKIPTKVCIKLSHLFAKVKNGNDYGAFMLMLHTKFVLNSTIRRIEQFQHQFFITMQIWYRFGVNYCQNSTSTKMQYCSVENILFKPVLWRIRKANLQ